MWSVLLIALTALIAAALLLPMTAWGMRTLYAELVRRLTKDDPRVSVDPASATTLVLSLETEHGTTTFTLEQTLLRLAVRWTNVSPETGLRTRAWRFFKFASQRKMVDRIFDDLLVEHRTMMRS